MQTVIAVSASAVVLVPALGLSATSGVGAIVIAVAATVTRLMQIPQVAELLNKYFRVPMP